MNTKKPVHFKPYISTKYSYEKLRVCKNCRNFTVLGEQECTACGKPALIPVHKKAEANARRSMHTTILISILIGLIGVFFGETFLQMILCALVAVALVIVLWFIQRKAMPAEISRELIKLFQTEQKNIEEGMLRNYKEAIAHWDTDKQLTYEMLREMNTLIRNDTVRLRMIALLHTFILRKDMELVLEPLLVRHYEPLLAEYIGEMAKIKRELIKDKTFKYVTTFEPEIMGQEHGLDILTGVVGAAVRMKRYVLANQGLVRRYAYNLPKDRFLRLYRMIQQYPDENWARLSDEVTRIYKEKYQWDPDFQQSSQRDYSI